MTQRTSPGKIVPPCSYFQEKRTNFPPKLPHNLNGRVIKFGVVIVPPSTCDRIGGGYAGTHISLVRSMADTLNFTAVFIASNNVRTAQESEPSRLECARGPWRTVLAATLSGEVSAALGGFVMWPPLLEDFSSIQTIDQEVCSFFVTSNLILTSRTDGLILTITLQMITVQLVTALAMHALTRSVERRTETYASTTMMVKTGIEKIFYILNRLLAHRSVKKFMPEAC